MTVNEQTTNEQVTFSLKSKQIQNKLFSLLFEGWLTNQILSDYLKCKQTLLYMLQVPAI